jgi:hypothetical protein
MSGFARRLQQATGVLQTISGTILAKDDFDRADGSLGIAEVGGTWTTYVGIYTNTPAWQVSSDKVTIAAPDGTNNWLVGILPVSVSAGTIFCDMYLSPGSANTAVCLRASNDGNTYLNVQLNKSSTYDRFAISKRAGGTTTWVDEDDAAGLQNGTGYSVAVVFTASDMTVYVDGTSQLYYQFSSQDLIDLAGDTLVGLRSWVGPSDDDGGSFWDRFLVTSDTGVPAVRTPAVPWNVVAVNSGDTQADISWSRGGNGGSALTGYVLTSSNGPSFTINDPSATSFTATGLNNVAQTFTLKAVNALGESGGAVSNSVTPAAATVPNAPTAVTAEANDAQATVSWTAPANNGGSPIINYTVTSNPGNIQATTADTSVVVTGLTNGTAYTFTVKATNVVGESAASAPSNSVTPTASSGVLYGPDGSRWPTRTPAWNSPITTTVSSIAALNTAIAANVNTPGAVVIGLTDGNYADSSITINNVSGMSARSQNILIRPVNPGAVTFGGQLKDSCDCTTIAGFTGGFYLNGTTNQRAARMYLPSSSNWTVNGVNNCEIVECVATDRPTVDSGDRGDIKSANDTVNIPPRDITITGCWFEGLNISSTGTGHVDNLQVLCMSGSFTMKNTYIGGGGNSGTILYKNDFQRSNPYADVSYDTCFLGHDTSGSDDFWNGLYTINSLAISHVRCTGGTKMVIQDTTWNPPCPITMTDVQGSNLKWISKPTGAGHTLTLPGFTINTGLTTPAFVKPPWAWW